MTLDDLDRPTLVRMAYEYMLFGMLATRAMLPNVILVGGDMDMLNDVAIDEWMGASPVYTARMRRLMGIEGDGIEAIMKALQLDVGFVHGYMDVAYKLIDERHGEFWLRHCGALLDAEPMGPDQVFGMCHTIEDPTFDATALATNPRACIRPIHRPPRQPADRHPHCHWTIEIDPANEPVGPAKLTGRVAALPLAVVANAARPGEGMQDYRGPLRPEFRLTDLSDGALAAVSREFQVQSHLLLCAGEMAFTERFDEATARRVAVDSAVGAGWTVSERLARALRVDGDAAGLAQVLGLHPMIPPGFERTVSVDGDRVSLRAATTVPGLLTEDHMGYPGVLARGDTDSIAAMVHAVAPTAAVEVRRRGAELVIDVDVAAGLEAARLPDAAALTQIGICASWDFEPLTA
jgi:hypothetical protein